MISFWFKSNHKHSCNLNLWIWKLFCKLVCSFSNLVLSFKFKNFDLVRRFCKTCSCYNMIICTSKILSIFLLYQLTINTLLTTNMCARSEKRCSISKHECCAWIGGDGVSSGGGGNFWHSKFDITINILCTLSGIIYVGVPCPLLLANHMYLCSFVRFDQANTTLKHAFQLPFHLLLCNVFLLQLLPFVFHLGMTFHKFFGKLLD